MKVTFLKAAAAGIAIAAGVAGSGAQAATVAATANATILEIVELDEVAQLNFGVIAPDPLGTGIVTVSQAGGITCPLPVRCFGGHAAGAFTVSGAAGRTVTITVPAAPATLTNGTTTMSVSNFSAPATLILTGGLDPFNVGAQIDVLNGQQAGVYAGNYNISADYQ